MAAKRKICIVTGSRAEYGLLYWLINQIHADKDLKLQIIATGMHLSPEFGLTYKVIEKDGFRINEKVEMLLSSDSPVGITKSIGLAIISFADALERLKPDILVLVGDRFEILAAAQAALILKIPIAHLHGGETTEGAIDEAFRHSLTKMSHLHFVTAETYRRRVIQMGEDPERVYNFGAPGLDNISKLELLSLEDLEKAIEFKFGKTNFLITYHPATLGSKSPQKVMKELFKALDNFPKAKMIFTMQNSDAEGRIIGQMINEYVRQNQDRAKAYVSLGQLKYLSAMKYSDVIIGNSSSGIIETPAMKKPTVNMGTRQKGRLKASSVIDCKERSSDIIRAIKKALSAEFQRQLPKVRSLYGTGNTSERIKEVLKTYDLRKILVKRFYDIHFQSGSD